VNIWIYKNNSMQRIGIGRSIYTFVRPCHKFRRSVLTPGGPGSCPCQSMWDLWWRKWQWERFPSESFCFPLSILFHRCSIFTHVSSGGWTKGPFWGPVPQKHSLTPSQQQYMRLIKMGR
jgi:hypothetical protein